MCFVPVLRRDELNLVTTGPLGVPHRLFHEDTPDPSSTMHFANYHVLDHGPRSTHVGEVRHNHHVDGTSDLFTVDLRHQESPGGLADDPRQNFPSQVNPGW